MGSMGIVAAGHPFSSLRTVGSTFVSLLRAEVSQQEAPETKHEFLFNRQQQANLLSANMARVFDIERPEMEE